MGDGVEQPRGITDILVSMAGNLGKVAGTLDTMSKSQDLINAKVDTVIDNHEKRIASVEKWKIKVAALCLGASTAGGGLAHRILGALSDSPLPPPGGHP